ncbi:MAG: hypothetical protein ACOZNI_12680 [Myxococcota bacterium]
MRSSVPLLLALAACRGADTSDVKSPDPGDSAAGPAFDAPWEGLDATDEAAGAFEADIGDDLAGPGWFHTGSDAVWGAEGAWARVEEPEGASEPIVVVSIGGRAQEQVLVLQIVAPRSAWGEGELTVDGTSAAGVLTRYEGGTGTPFAYVVGGTVSLAEAGDADGEDVRGEFSSLSIAEVTP